MKSNDNFTTNAAVNNAVANANPEGGDFNNPNFSKAKHDSRLLKLHLDRFVLILDTSFSSFKTRRDEQFLSGEFAFLQSKTKENALLLFDATAREENHMGTNRWREGI